MARLQIDIPDDVAEAIKRRASDAGLTVSEYVSKLFEQPPGDAWPDGFFERVAGGWCGTALERPEQGELEDRADPDW